MINQKDNIILIGPMGSGKTSTGRMLAKEMGYVFAIPTKKSPKEQEFLLHTYLMLRAKKALEKENV